MLIRQTTADDFECVYQEHHALLSGVLAAAWVPTRIDPRWIQAAGLHDTPWRRADEAPIFNEETGLLHDFLTYPEQEKLKFYREGIDELENIDPFTAYVVSRRYASFARSADGNWFQEHEKGRQQRLVSMLGEVEQEELDEALAWVNFFDTFSIYLCLAGPKADQETTPRWLVPPSWSTAPDATELEFEWLDDETLKLTPWPFGSSQVSTRIHFRHLAERVARADEMQRRWADAPRGMRDLLLVPR